ncbi:diaminopimelate epimerase [Paenibacillus barcinonensis]|uniref:Diaminopimelate epimerase n=1 Tax=Paenibacillus barcinonensis TaxID=198119 RepID=A0A2V4WAJ9_PAEBA|nr:diaminopimelate epimerase [Paenibacillus barcinonensis]PYE48277.1 diaminopimelate epimerase [Paenibacillus barcinonensis]QKS56876.1 diaminopimelate epimerase [Paenibacillus barcinonensis]
MKHEIDFIKCSPTQNMTILVKTNHAAEHYSDIASSLMSYDHVYAEQVGFIEQPRRQEAAARLEMAGGEFCGNACMALAAHVAYEKGLEQQSSMNVKLDVSGTESLIHCHVKKRENQYDCRVTMPVPEQIERKVITFEGLELELVVVRYAEFIHIVIEVQDFDDTMRRRAQHLARLLGLTMGDKMIGILLYRPATEEMAPLIYVPQLDSLIWERGCGSGTASVGAYLAWLAQGEVTQLIRQPGGTIKVTAQWHETGRKAITIEGNVRIVAHGTAFIDVPLERSQRQTSI